MNAIPDSVVIAPVLAADVRHYVRALNEAGRLRKVFGGAAIHESSTLVKLLALRPNWKSKLAARLVQNEIVPASKFHSQILPELRQKISRRGIGPADLDAVFAKIDSRAARAILPTDRLVLGREDGCLASFHLAKTIGATSVYDLPIPHHSELTRALRQEEELFPGASADRELGDTFHNSRLKRKDAEIAAANRFLVASDYVRSGLIETGIPAEKIAKVPYGCDGGKPFRTFHERNDVVLCVGHVSLRKGIPHLLNAWKKLGADRTFTLRLIGKKMLTDSFLAPYSGMFEYFPPMPRHELWKHFSEAKLFVFPSACDGFGLVMNESLSCGTPVLASNHTGAPGYLREGETGWTYRHGDDDALAERLEQALAQPRELAVMGENAHRFAQNWTWAEYRQSIRNVLAEFAPPA